MCVTDSQGEAAAERRELSSRLWDDLEGWDGGVGREEGSRAGVYVCTWLIHFTVQQKLNTTL